MASKSKGLLERFRDGEVVICAEGYLFEFERRGYLQAGTYVPEVVIEHPELVEALHREFVHAGSDVVLAFTFYLHREKLRLIGREADLERLNRAALRLARQVADDTGTLMAGNICSTNIYDPTDPAWEPAARAMFKEQIEWAVEGGADFIYAETFFAYAEARLALDCVKQYGNGLPAVVSISKHRGDLLFDGVPLEDALERLAEAGAAAVGLNCGRGPSTMLPLLQGLKDKIKVPLVAVPVPYRTHQDSPHFMTLKDPDGNLAFPLDLDPWLCSRSQIAAWSARAYALGVRYLGLCCGNASHFTRAMAEALGRQPPASRYTADMTKHAYYGTDPALIKFNTEQVRKTKF
ncbi:PREDICTED: betaine--homocysteine S-methyltransferase 1-like [Branchiostoma belcheri]|uniref:Betaine--homocysteine S-methyltransferase 1-like n=1 Tax=Branchiostoma belcheri TaxID=7741 RepID=A0A6P4YV70_BRABE|nr:PREDICTED: betaine--homocysteine S-methyltransferase 1-like [Branchiostoma belcheri]